MSKMSKAVAVLGVVAGLGVAAMPLATYAADPDNVANVNLSVEVRDSISLAASAPTVTIKPVNGGDVATGKVDLTVTTSNSKGYLVQAKTAATALTNGEGGTINPGTPQNNATTSAWGIMGGDIASYTGLSTANKDVKKTSTTPTDGAEVFDVTFGVATAANQPAGTYTGSVTFTATANI